MELNQIYRFITRISIIFTKKKFHEKKISRKKNYKNPAQPRRHFQESLRGVPAQPRSRADQRADPWFEVRNFGLKKKILN